MLGRQPHTAFPTLAGCGTVLGPGTFPYMEIRRLPRLFWAYYLVWETLILFWGWMCTPLFHVTVCTARQRAKPAANIYFWWEKRGPLLAAQERYVNIISLRWLSDETQVGGLVITIEPHLGLLSV